jgi:hypothetical protein
MSEPEAKPKVTPADWAHLVPPIFARCVDPDAVRYALQMPFVQDRWIYATDGRIAVRTAAPESWPFEPDGRPPRGIDACIFAGLAPRCEAEPINVARPEGECSACKGAKILPRLSCKECKGLGRISHGCNCEYCDDKIPCGECEGSGKVGPGPCEECYATGIRDPLGVVEIAPGCWIGRGFALLLSEFGASVFPPILRPSLTPIRFTVGETEGALMPMRPPSSEAD